MNDEERRDQGMKVRRDVLGNAYVDRTLANQNDFNRDFQDEIWSRPALPRHTRSLLTLAMMVALNREDEFKMHVRAALNNGVTRVEIQEVLLQSGIYCGLPAANSAFHWAQEILDSIDNASEPKP